MNSLEALEAEIRLLPKKEALQLQEWLADYLESQEMPVPEFIRAIESGKRDLAAGRVRKVTRATA